MIKFNRILLTKDLSPGISANLSNNLFTGICKLLNNLILSDTDGILYVITNIDSNPSNISKYILLSSQLNSNEHNNLSIVEQNEYDNNPNRKISIKSITRKISTVENNGTLLNVESIIFLAEIGLSEKSYELFEIDSSLQNITFISKLDLTVKKITFYLNNNLYVFTQESLEKEGNYVNVNKIKRYSLNNNKFSLSIDIKFMSNIANIFYNSTDGYLYLIDSTKLYCLDNTFSQVNITNLIFPNQVNDPQGIWLDNNLLYIICNSNNISNKLFKLNVSTTEETIKHIYYIKLIIKQIRYGSKLIWSLIAGCFGSGIWISSELWSDDDIWKNNA